MEVNSHKYFDRWNLIEPDRACTPSGPSPLAEPRYTVEVSVVLITLDRIFLGMQSPNKVGELHESGESRPGI